jgi:hypothetical protein
VLRHDVATRAYGSLLIEMAGRSPRLSLGVSHLSESSAALKRRLRAMTAGMPRWARTRAAGFAAMAALAILAACETRMPTAAEVSALDVQGAESHARTLGAIPGLAGAVTYTLDGKSITAAQAHAIPAADIERMNVQGNVDGHSEVAIWTKAGAAASGVSEREFMAPAQTRAQATVTSAAQSNALVVIDGVVADAAALHALRPDQIVTVNVYKGDGASRRFTDPRASNGVIEVTTRRAAATP